MKNLLFAGAVLGLCLTVTPLTASAQEGPGEGATTAESAEANSIQWIDGWSEGKAAAAKSGRLMLVYVHRTSPP